MLSALFWSRVDRVTSLIAYTLLTTSFAYTFKLLSSVLLHVMPPDVYLCLLHWFVVIFVLDAWTLMKDLNACEEELRRKRVPSWQQHYMELATHNTQHAGELSKHYTQHAEEMSRIHAQLQDAHKKIDTLQYVIRCLDPDCVEKSVRFKRETKLPSPERPSRALTKARRSLTSL